MSQRVFLSGPMGSGKSRVARALAELWRTAAVDLDEVVARRAGKSIGALFAERGEAGFRALEGEALSALLTQGARIISLGGGTVTSRELRRRLLDAGVLVTLTAPLDTLVRRVGSGAGRPLLEGDHVRSRLSRLLQERAAAYAECHGEVETDGRHPEDLAREIDALVSEEPLVVPLAERTYRVEVGHGTRHGLAARSRRAVTGRDVVLVTDRGVERPWSEQARQQLRDAGFAVTPVVLEAGEEHKHIQSIERIWDAALGAGVDRDALVVAIGGGVVGDMAGFAASTILRGIALAQVPTTLLAMVDSAVGGKTGIDRPQGKNLIGSFQQPRFVLCDVETLSTLPLAERRAGLAEVVKSAWLDSEASVRLLEERAEDLTAGDLEATEQAVRMSVRLKAKIVTEDEREAGSRALLNLGHTLGHAIEAAGGYKALRHGEAVALGMEAAFRVSQRLGLASAEQGARMHQLLGRLGLPTDLDRYLDARTFGFLGSDKKRKGGKVRFVVPKAPGDTALMPLSLEEIVRLASP